MNLTRRAFCQSVALATASGMLRSARAAEGFKLNYIVSTPMYGYSPLADILPEVPKTGTVFVDIWPKIHGNQREQVDEMGVEKFRALLQSTGTKLGCSTRYDLTKLKGAEMDAAFIKEIEFVASLGGSVIVTGIKGPKDAKGPELKAAVKTYVESLKPQLDAAAKHHVTLAIENHAGSMLSSPDSLRYLAEHCRGNSLGIAFAPHHLPQDGELQGKLIDELGDAVKFFYAQQEGKGSKVAQPINDELTQMPGRGPLDFAPLIRALAKHKFRGFTSIYMHPVPRGRIILPTIPEVTAEINKSRAYLDGIAASI
jgi:sugar phosphate isomerase/epimerase